MSFFKKNKEKNVNFKNFFHRKKINKMKEKVKYYDDNFPNYNEKYLEIQKYLNDKNENRSLMISGKWGSGKTFFIKEYLIKKLFLEGKRKVIYVSLYSLEKVSDIPKEIFNEIYMREKRPKRFFRMRYYFDVIKNYAPSLVTGVIKKLTGFELISNKQISKYEKYINKDNVVLVLDDLERSKINVFEIFSYINFFSEEMKVKILVLANENEVKKKNKQKNSDEQNQFEEEYNSHYNKVFFEKINFVFPFKDIENAISLICKKNDFKLKKNEIKKISFQLQLNKENFRTLKDLIVIHIGFKNKINEYIEKNVKDNSIEKEDFLDYICESFLSIIFKSYSKFLYKKNDDTLFKDSSFVCKVNLTNTQIYEIFEKKYDDLVFHEIYKFFLINYQSKEIKEICERIKFPFEFKIEEIENEIKKLKIKNLASKYIEKDSLYNSIHVLETIPKILEINLNNDDFYQKIRKKIKNLSVKEIIDNENTGFSTNRILFNMIDISDESTKKIIEEMSTLISKNKIKEVCYFTKKISYEDIDKSKITYIDNKLEEEKNEIFDLGNKEIYLYFSSIISKIEKDIAFFRDNVFIIEKIKKLAETIKNEKPECKMTKIMFEIIINKLSSVIIELRKETVEEFLEKYSN